MRRVESLVERGQRDGEITAGRLDESDAARVISATLDAVLKA
jgi:hypothetical protein